MSKQILVLSSILIGVTVLYGGFLLRTTSQETALIDPMVLDSGDEQLAYGTDDEAFMDGETVAVVDSEVDAEELTAEDQVARIGIFLGQADEDEEDEDAFEEERQACMDKMDALRKQFEKKFRELDKQRKTLEKEMRKQMQTSEKECSKFFGGGSFKGNSFQQPQPPRNFDQGQQPNQGTSGSERKPFGPFFQGSGQQDQPPVRSTQPPQDFRPPQQFEKPTDFKAQESPERFDRQQPLPPREESKPTSLLDSVFGHIWTESARYINQ